MICKIADFYIEIRAVHAYAEHFCRDYICDSAPQVDFVIETTEADIAKEQQSSAVETPNARFSDAYIETLAIYRKICAELLQRNAFLMHGAVIEYAGKGYLFTAKSGTGKTTHIRLWKRVFGEDKVTIVNGDKPILRVLNGKVYAYGTPWCGKEGYNTNTRVELSSICFVHRAQENSVQKIPAETAISLIFSQVMITDSSDLAKQLELLDILVSKVPLYRLNCNMEPDAARVAYEGINK